MARGVEPAPAAPVAPAAPHRLARAAPARRVSVTPLRPVPDVETRVLLVCGGSLMRAGYRAVLEADHQLTVSAEADGVDEAVELARELRPDVVLIDVPGAGGDCVSATAELSADP